MCYCMHRKITFYKAKAICPLRFLKFEDRYDCLFPAIPFASDSASSLRSSPTGCLTVTIKRANNLKQVMGGTNAFCKLNISQGPSHQTKVVSRNTSPEWKEAFTWAFDVPPKGQKLHIQCKSKNTFGKVVSRNTSPEWKEAFTWAFDVAPKGQKLHIQCKSKNTFGKSTLGEVIIQIDKVVSDGVFSGVFSLRNGHGTKKEGSLQEHLK
ncbi:Armadillo [Artemisia annua]|uniref:Armadillo n=1 Tax=Artemisia annua TaxID=35608 RepID=A0A2U1QF85_ARTAN|nr:Armadillo [Artemisia annua]